MAIVVGYLSSGEGRAALSYAKGEADRRSVPLVVVSSHKGGPGVSREEAVRFEDELENVNRQLASESRKYQVRPVLGGTCPNEDLLAVAEEVDAEAIVIGLQQRSPVGKFLLGSNSQQILLDARCPVIAVKPSYSSWN